MKTPLSKWRLAKVALAFAILGSACDAARALEVNDLAALRKRFGLEAYDALPAMRARLKDVQIAILDNGFGAPAFREKVLPSTLFTVVPSYDKALIEKYKLGTFESQVALDERDEHGLRLALLTWATTGFDATEAPRFHLLNANGLTNFERAVRYCIEKKIDIILFSQNWEYGGNFDGRGFINRIVSHATSHGILWVNAAGNYGGRAFNGRIESREPGWIPLGPGGNGLRFKSRLDNNPVRIVLSWNSYGEEEGLGTDKDLDLFVYDEKEQLVLRSDLKQIRGGPGITRREGESFVPRELISARIARNRSGHYRIRVASRSRTFNATDRLRVTVQGQKGSYFDAAEKRQVEAIDFLDATKGEEIMVPADHPEVLAVGDLTPVSAVGPTADNRAKPDLVLTSSVAEFSDGEGTSGTSNAAAIFTGIVAVLKAHTGTLRRSDVLRYVSLVKPSLVHPSGSRPGIEDLGIEAVRRAHPAVLSTIERILDPGVYFPSPVLFAGRERNGHYVVALSRSPLELGVAFPNFPPRDQAPGSYEIFLRPSWDGSVVGHWRYKERAPGAAEQPWEDHLRQQPERFVQVVLAERRDTTIAEETAVPLWTTPIPTSD